MLLRVEMDITVFSNVWHSRHSGRMVWDGVLVDFLDMVEGFDARVSVVTHKGCVWDLLSALCAFVDGFGFHGWVEVLVWLHLPGWSRRSLLSLYDT